MSILGSIMSKVFGHSGARSCCTGDRVRSAGAGGSSRRLRHLQADADFQGGRRSTPHHIASNYSHPVNWKTSIVDLMAILGIDNSLAQRKALAKELGYTGDMNDSATMNIRLHRQVMQKLEENGGYVPDDLRD